MICSVCEEYAAISSNDAKKPPMCGNCAILDAKGDTAGLRKAEETKKARAKIKSGTDAGSMVAQFDAALTQAQTENTALKIENADLKARLAAKDDAVKPAQPFGSSNPSEAQRIADEKKAADEKRVGDEKRIADEKRAAEARSHK